MPNDSKLPKPTQPDPEHWLELADKASKKTDPKRLREDVRQLCEELEQPEASLRRARAPKP